MRTFDLNILDDIASIKKVDASDMLSKLVTFSRQCEGARGIPISNHSFIDSQAISNIVVSGVGGSAIVGDLLRTYLLDRMSLPVLVNRDYVLPRWISPSSLLFLISYSGNTEETLSAFTVAVERNIPFICITSGGVLRQWALEQEKCVIEIPTGYPPRTALGYLFFPMLNVLSRAGFIREEEADIEETIVVLKKESEANQPGVPIDRNPAKKLALQVHGNIPLIYASE